MSSKIHLLFRQIRRRRLNVPFGSFRNHSLDNLKYIKSKCRASAVTQEKKEAGLCARAVGTRVRRPVLFSFYFLLRAASHRNCLPGQKAGLRIMDLLLFHLERLFGWINSATSITNSPARAVCVFSRGSATLSLLSVWRSFCVFGATLEINNSARRFTMGRFCAPATALFTAKYLPGCCSGAALQVLMQRLAATSSSSSCVKRPRVCMSTCEDAVFTCASPCAEESALARKWAHSRAPPHSLNFSFRQPGANCSRPLRRQIAFRAWVYLLEKNFITPARNLVVPEYNFFSCRSRKLAGILQEL